MTRVCEVVGCPAGNYRKKSETYQFFRIPKSASTRKRWLENINRENFNPPVDKDYCVCDRHFAESDFIPPDHRHKRRRLKPHAVPRFHMRPPKEPEPPLDKRSRHIRAKQRLEEKRYEPEISTNVQDFNHFNGYLPYSRMRRLSFPTAKNAKSFSIELDEVPEKCLKSRIIVNATKNVTKLPGGIIKTKVEYVHKGKYNQWNVEPERLIVQETIVNGTKTCLAWRLEATPKAMGPKSLLTGESNIVLNTMVPNLMAASPKMSTILVPKQDIAKHAISQHNMAWSQSLFSGHPTTSQLLSIRKVPEPTIFVNGDNVDPFQRVDIKEEVIEDPLGLSQPGPSTTSIKVETLDEADIGTANVVIESPIGDSSENPLSIKEELEVGAIVNNCNSEFIDSSIVKEEPTEIAFETQ